MDMLKKLLIKKLQKKGSNEKKKRMRLKPYQRKPNEDEM